MSPFLFWDFLNKTYWKKNNNAYFDLPNKTWENFIFHSKTIGHLFLSFGDCLNNNKSEDQ